jgi:hypothetical protein
MDIERIVVRLIADATQYNYVMDIAIKSLRTMVRGVIQVLSGFGTIVKNLLFAPFKLAGAAIVGAFQALSGMVRGPLQALKGMFQLFEGVVLFPQRLARAAFVMELMFNRLMFSARRLLSALGPVGMQLGFLARGMLSLARIAFQVLFRGLPVAFLTTGLRLFIAQIGHTFTALSRLPGAMRNFGTTVVKFFTTLAAQLQKLYGGIFTGVKNIAGGLMAMFSGLARGFVTVASAMLNVMKGLAEGVIGIAKGLMTIVKGILSGGFLTAIAMLTGIALATGFAFAEAVKTAAEYENVAIAFEVMTGSAKEAKYILDQINVLAVNTPFKATELLASAKQIKAFGFETDQILPVLSTLGEVASGTGTPLERIALAFGQVKVAGRLMGPELRQFTDAGIPLIEELAQVMKRPVTAIKSLVEAGEVGFPTVVMAFNRMTQAGGIYSGMMERQSETVMGRWTSLVENLQIAARNVGLAFFKGFGLTEVLDEFSKKAGGVQKVSEEMVTFFGRLRGVFDALRAAVTAVAIVLGENFAGALGGLAGMNVTWENMEEVAVAAIEAIIMGIGHMVETVKYAAREMADKFILPIAKFMQSMRGPQNNGQGGGLLGFDGVGGMGRAAMKEMLMQFMPVPDIAQFMKDSGAAGDSLAQLALAIKNSAQEGNAAGRMRDLFREEYNRLKAMRGQGGDPTIYENMNRVVMGLGDAVKSFEKVLMAIRVPLQASAAAQKLAAKTIEDFGKKGEGGYDQFLRVVELLQETQDLQFKRGVAFNAFGIPVPKDALLDQAQADFGLLQALGDLRKFVGNEDWEKKLPEAIARGSAEAQDVINRSMRDPGGMTVQQEIAQLLREAKEIQEAQKKVEENELQVLRDMERKGMFIKPKKMN